MKKRIITLLLTAALILTLFPATAAAATTLEVGSGLYPLSEKGLNDAISAANNGDTIRFMADGTIKLTDKLSINKSITLDLNGHKVGLSTIYLLSIASGYSVTVKGSGTITTNTFIQVENTAALTVQDGAVIEGAVIEAAGFSTPALINYGTVSMTGGSLRQTNGRHVLINAGAATFHNVTIETSNGSGWVIWADGGTLTLNNCITTNNFTEPMTGTGPSVILVANSAAVTLNDGSVTAPAGSTLPAILVHKNATLTNNGAAITGGYVIKHSDLSVSVSSGAGKVTLAQ